MRATRAAISLLFAVGCTPPLVARVSGVDGEPPSPVPGAVPSATLDAAPSRELMTAIDLAVASAPPDPPPIDEGPAPPVQPAKPEGHLAFPVCVGPVPLKKVPPRTASCCYPAREMLTRPIRAVYPALRACYEARTKKDAAGRVVFHFRVEQDGTIQRVCTGDATSVDDEDAVRCMVGEVRKARFPAMGDAERDLCGLVTLDYPVVFEP